MNSTVMMVICYVLGAIAFVLLAPLLIYLCVKLGTLGYYRARRIMEKTERD